MKNLLSELRRRGWLISKPDENDVLYILDLTFINEMKTCEVRTTISTYEGDYVLFVKGKVVDRDYDIQRLVRRTLKKYKPDEIYITNVGRPRKLVTIGF